VNDQSPFRPQDEQDRANLMAVVDRANTGDPNAIAELRAILDANPHIWRKLGDMAYHAKTSWISLLSSDNSLLVESLVRETARLRADLVGDGDRPLEKMLIDQIVSIHLEVRYREQRFADHVGLTLKQESLNIKALESAHRRLMQATKTLEQIRSMPKQKASRPSLRVVQAADAS
jgi:hypothetical protein